MSWNFGLAAQGSPTISDEEKLKFISMGEVLLPEAEISKASPSAIAATTRIQWTFPLAFGEIGRASCRERV